MTINTETLKSVMRNWVSGIAIVSSQFEGVNHGMTVNSFTSVSIDPARIVVTLAKQTRTYNLIIQSGKFGITILSDKQKDLSDRFAGKIAEDKDRFSEVDTFTIDSGIPFIREGLAWLECEVEQIVDLGNSTLFIAKVMEAGTGKGNPLLYHDRFYFHLGEKYD